MTEEKGKQWSTKYRPDTVESVIENVDAKSEVQGIIEKNDAHAILFMGPSGCGKTTLAKVLAKGLTKYTADIIEENTGSKNSIQDVRGWIEASRYVPQGKNKVFILDEVHALKGQQQSAILKTIEEPEHDRVVWILCTDRPQLLDAPLLNRLMKIQVQKPSAIGLAKLLYHVAKTEKAFNLDEKKVKRICKEVAAASDRVPREALQLLQQVSRKSSNYESFTDLVVQGIRKVAEQGIDKTALQVLMSFYSDERKLDDRARFLVTQLTDKDVWGLTMRLTDIHYQLMQFIGGVKGGPGYYHHKILEETKSIPDLRLGMKVSSRLVQIRNTLNTINTKIEHYVVPELLNLLYEIEDFKK